MERVVQPTEKFAKFAGKFVKLEEGHTTIYVPKSGEFDEDELMWTIEDYHPMESLEDGQELVALSYHGTSKDDDPIGFIAVDNDKDLIWVYEDGNDEPLQTPASQVTLSSVSD